MIVTQTLQQFLPHKTIVTSPKNFNGELGLSLSIFEITSWEPKIWTFVRSLCVIAWKTFFGTCSYDIIVLEYGIDRPKEMEFLLTIAKPDIGIFTAIDAVHSEQFGNPQEIAREEVKMVKNTKSTVFLNSADPYAMEVATMLDVDQFSYQTMEPIKAESNHEDIHFDSASFVLDDKQMPKLQAKLSIKNQHLTIRTNLLSKENL